MVEIHSPVINRACWKLAEREGRVSSTAGMQQKGVSGEAPQPFLLPFFSPSESESDLRPILNISKQVPWQSETFRSLLNANPPAFNKIFITINFSCQQKLIFTFFTLFFLPIISFMDIFFIAFLAIFSNFIDLTNNRRRLVKNRAGC